MLVHAGRIKPRRDVEYLLLHKERDAFVWHRTGERTACVGSSVPSALAAARKKWALDAFRPLHCGFRYALPVRDEVGRCALFWEMVRSYESMNQSYFDEEAGHFCYVDFASTEALALWRSTK